MKNLLKSFLTFIFALVFFFLSTAHHNANASELSENGILIWEQESQSTEEGQKLYVYAPEEKWKPLLFIVENPLPNLSDALHSDYQRNKMGATFLVLPVYPAQKGI